jgi:hypothetical protein
VLRRVKVYPLLLLVCWITCTTDAGLEALSSLVHLTQLELSGFNPPGLDQLPTALSHLKTLMYQDTYPPPPASLGAKALLMKPPQGFRALAKLPQLSHLDTGESHWPGALAILAGKLTALTLRVPGGEGAAGEGRCSLPAGGDATARKARRGGCSTTTEQYQRVVFSALLQLRELQEFRIKGMQLSRSDVEQLMRGLTGLRSLDVEHCEVRWDCCDRGLVQSLVGMKKLQSLKWPRRCKGLRCSCGEPQQGEMLINARFELSGQAGKIKV